jgi:DUF1680 family protein
MPVTRRELIQTAGCGCVALSLLNVFRTALAQTPVAKSAGVADQMAVLPAGAIHLDGYLENYIQLSLRRWSKGVVPYRALAAFFSSGRPRVDAEGRSVELFATGEMWGKAVSATALSYRYTSDPQLKALLKSTVADLLSMRRSNGTISCSPVEMQPDGPGGDVWERTKVLLALDDYYNFVEADPAVLSAMIEEADATINQIGPPPKVRIVDLGWSKGLVDGNNVESSTILQPIMRLYQRTGYSRYMEFARYIVETEGGALHHRIFDEILTGEDLVAVGGVYPKGCETNLLFEGLAEYYRATGNDRWRQASVQYFRKAIEKEITIIGNGGGDQPYHPNVRGEAWNNTGLEQTNPNIQRMMETCTGVTWLKLCHQILRLTADPMAADYIELYAYNGLIGAMKPEGDGFSYVNLLNGVKTNKTGWGTVIEGVYVTCCNLIGPEGLAYLPFTAVMSDKDGPVFNLYNAGTVNLAEGPTGKALFTIETGYPLHGAVRIRIAPEVPRNFTVKLRIPAWSEKTSLQVNGKIMQARAGRFVSITRRWVKGDVIELNLDMRCRLIKARHGLSDHSDRFVALMRGPVVLARDENIDPNFASPVDILAFNDIVEVKASAPTLSSANMQFDVPTRTGTIPMVDYASVNSWQGKRVQTWLPVAIATS